MKPMQKMKALKTAFALAAVLVMTGAAWAKQGGGPGIPGDLTPTRDSVDLSVPVVGFPLCNTLDTNQTYSVKAYIFQPSGRIFAIGIGYNTADFGCGTDPTTSVDVPVKVDAFPGLTFKPGPATLLYQVIQTQDDGDPNTPTVDSVIYEYGSRVDLHP